MVQSAKDCNGPQADIGYSGIGKARRARIRWIPAIRRPSRQAANRWKRMPQIVWVLSASGY